jgi:hypothetical protein
MSERSSAGERARDGQDPGPCVDQHEAGVERPRGSAGDLRKAGSGLDRRGDRVERSEVEPTRRP